jgi:hypothetical protein
MNEDHHHALSVNNKRLFFIENNVPFGLKAEGLE